jgi:tetratricopeptide (TPR) repeat protein
VVPTAYPGDLVLLRAARDLGRPPMPVAEAAAGPLYTVAVDVDARAVRAAGPGEVAARPPAGKPRARLHHTAPSRKGNSGGALIDADGRLVAVVTAGGEGRNDAIPASHLARLRAMSGPEHAAASARLGRAYRRCIEGLERTRGGPEAEVVDACEATGNRELWDQAGRALGQAGRYDAAVRLFRMSLAQDPNNVNSRLALAVTYHRAGRYADELPLLRRLLDSLPADFGVLRMAVQAARETGDAALGERALALIERHHPQAAPQARAFLEGEAGGHEHDHDHEEGHEHDHEHEEAEP